ncbi:hypothetical protein D3C87_2098370 [compost metagenome]
MLHHDFLGPGQLRLQCQSKCHGLSTIGRVARDERHERFALRSEEPHEIARLDARIRHAGILRDHPGRIALDRPLT